MKEPEKKIGGLTSLYAVEHEGNDGLKEICAVERSTSALTQVLQRQFDQEISAKTFPRRRRRKQARSTRMRARTASTSQPNGMDLPPETGGRHRMRREDAGDVRKHLMSVT